MADASLARSGIYEIVNTVNGKRYIGSAAVLFQRWNEHRSGLRRGKHHSKPLQNAWRKHGEQAFVFRPLLICATDTLLTYEQIAFDALTPEYNVCRVAGSTFGKTHSDETKRKIAAKALGRVLPPRSPEYRANVSARFRGKPKSAEHMAALQAGRNARVVTADQRQAVSKALRRAYVTGLRSRVKTTETRHKLSKAFAKLSEQDVREIKRLRAAGVTGRSLAKTYSTPASTISQIVNGLRYRWVE